MAKENWSENDGQNRLPVGHLTVNYNYFVDLVRLGLNDFLPVPERYIG